MPKLTVRPVPPPTLPTLRRYGLTPADWDAMVRRQRGVCPVCRQPFGDRRLVVDHEHVAGFKARRRRKARRVRNGERATVRVRVMPQDERRRHVRGILHAWCNGYVRAWLTLDRAESILEYLRAHEARRNARNAG